MIYISHRGNTVGKDQEKENSPEHILNAISKGFHVEIDIWIIDKKIKLGHDYPQYEVDKDFIKKITNASWFHCKNLEALYTFYNGKFPKVTYFWHEKDRHTLVSNNLIWSYPGQEITDRSILVMPETLQNLGYKDIIDMNPYGICSDYIQIYRDAFVAQGIEQ